MVDLNHDVLLGLVLISATDRLSSQHSSADFVFVFLQGPTSLPSVTEPCELQCMPWVTIILHTGHPSCCTNTTKLSFLLHYSSAKCLSIMLIFSNHKAFSLSTTAKELMLMVWG